MQQQQAAPSQFSISDDQWKITSQTEEVRKNLMQKMMRNAPTIQIDVLRNFENQCYQESQTHKDYYHRVVTAFQTYIKQHGIQLTTQPQQQMQNQNVIQQQYRPSQTMIPPQQQQMNKPMVTSQQLIPQQATHMQMQQNVVKINTQQPAANMMAGGNSTAQNQQLKMQLQNQLQQQQQIRPQMQYQPNVQQQPFIISQQQAIPSQQQQHQLLMQQQQQNLIGQNIQTSQQIPAQMNAMNQATTTQQTLKMNINMNQQAGVQSTTSVNTPQNIQQQQYAQQQQLQQPPIQQQPPQMSTEEDQAYNRKIQDLRQYLPRLDKMLANANAANKVQETSKIKAFIDVVQGAKIVTMDVLLKCEHTLIQQVNQQRVVTQQHQTMPAQQGLQQQQQQQPNQTQIQKQQSHQIHQQIPNQQQQMQMKQQVYAANTPQQVLNQPQQQIIQQPNQRIQQTNAYQSNSQHIQQPILPNQQQLVQQQSQPPPQQPSMMAMQQNMMMQQQPKQQIIQQLPHPQMAQKPEPTMAQPQAQVKIQTVQQQQQPTVPQVMQQQPQIVTAPPHISLYQQIQQSIEACHNSNPVHKNNVRYILESVKMEMNGPPLKLFKIDSGICKLDNDLTTTTISIETAGDNRKRLTSLHDNLNKLKQQQVNNEENIPKKLLIELHSLSSLKFKIEIKAKRESLVFPLQKKQNNNSVCENNNNLIDVSNNNSNNSGQTYSLENEYVTLKCMIEDKSLPLVPLIRIFVPYNYPESNPSVDCIQLDDFDDDMLPEYNTLGILRKVNKLFQINYLNLPDRYSVTQVLDAWRVAFNLFTTNKEAAATNLMIPNEEKTSFI